MDRKFFFCLMTLFSCIFSFADTWDPTDNVFTGATELSEPAYVLQSHGPHTIDDKYSTDGVDWFKIFLKNGISYEFHVMSASINPFLLSINKSQYASLVNLTSDVGSNLSFQFTPESDDFYYLSIENPPKTLFSASYYINYIAFPTPTPTPTYTPRPTSTPTPTFTPNPTPSFTPIPKLSPIIVIGFDEENPFTRISGGFLDPPAKGGLVFTGGVPTSPGKSDGEGVMIIVAPDEVELFMFPAIDIGEGIAFLRCFVHSSGGGASIALAGLDGKMDGSIATNIPVDSSIYQDRFHRMMVLVDPPGTTVVPVFQVSNLGGKQAVSVYIDNLEIYALQKGIGLPADLLED